MILRNCRYLREREKKSIQKIVVGAHFTAILDDMSNIYTFGLGDLGQLGHNNRKSYSQPRKVESLALYLAATESSTGSGAASGGGSRTVPKASAFIGVTHISQKVLVS